MDVARDAFPDLDRLNLAELKSLLLAQQDQLHSQSEELRYKDEQLLTKDEQLRLHQAEIENLKLLILKLRRLQFGQKSEQRARQIEQLELWVGASRRTTPHSVSENLTEARDLRLVA